VLPSFTPIQKEEQLYFSNTPVVAFLNSTSEDRLWNMWYIVAYCRNVIWHLASFWMKFWCPTVICRSLIFPYVNKTFIYISVMIISSFLLKGQTRGHCTLRWFFCAKSTNLTEPSGTKKNSEVLSWNLDSERRAILRVCFLNNLPQTLHGKVCYILQIRLWAAGPSDRAV
jgi:hypothetical protein